MKKLLSLFLLLAVSSCADVAHAYQLWTPKGTVDVVNAYPEGNKATYRASIAKMNSFAATPTDVFTLCGSATKTIKLVFGETIVDATAVGAMDIYIYKRTVANTGGTSSVMAASSVAKMDSNDPSPTAVLTTFTGNPSLGTGALVAVDHYAMPSTSTTGYPGLPWTQSFGNLNDRTLTLRGANQCMTYNLNGAALPSGFVLYATIVWTEE